MAQAAGQLIIDKDPLIIHGYGWENPIAPAYRMSPLLRGRKAYFLLSMAWTNLDDGGSANHLFWYAKHKAEFPEHELIFLCNSPFECKFFNKFGVKNIYCNHNAHLDSNLFRPKPEMQKRYDAVLNSRFDAFKRHILARHVTSLAIIGYTIGGNNEGNKYLKYLRRVMKHAFFANFDNSGDCIWLSESDIINIYHQSRVGLILSESEGGCFASCEYLLCGMPVVSTPSVGGRDAFFAPEYVRIVDPNPAAVLAAVEECKALDITPESIRAATIAKQQPHRERFRDLLGSIYAAEGLERDTQAIWNAVYVHKMFHHSLADDIPQFLRARGVID